MPKALIKVLLIEDNLADELLLKDSLLKDPLADFEVTVVEQLDQGLAELGTKIFDALLLDLGLPDCQGLDTFEKAHAAFPEMPTIVLSGTADELLALQAVQAGAQDYLVKGEAGWSLGPRAIRYAIERSQAQSAIRASETRFATVFRSTPAAVAITKLFSNTIMDVNEAWERITGYTSKEVIGKTLGELNLWALPEKRDEMIEILRRNGTVEEFEFQMRRKSGELADLLFSADAIEINGETCLLSMALDITERKQAEEKLLQSEQRSRALIENAPDGIVLIGLDGKYKFASPTALRLFGFTAEEILTNNPVEQIHPEDLPMLLAALQDLIQNPSTVPVIQYRFRHNDGSWRWIESTFTNLLAEPGVQAIVINFRDITERKQAEEMILQYMIRLEDAEKHAGLGNWEFDVTNGQGWWSKQMFRMFGLEGVDTPPNLDEYLACIHPEDRALVEEVLAQMARGEEPMPQEFRTNPERGPIHYFAPKVYSKKGADGKPLKFIGTQLDITEHKQMELELRKSEEQNRAIVAAVPDLLFQISRDGTILNYYASDKEMLLAPPEQFLGRKANEVLPPEVAEPGMAAFEKTFRTHCASMFEYELELKGEPHFYENRIVPLSNDEVLSVVRDITERKQAEKKLRESEERSRLAQDAAELGTWQEDIITHVFQMDERARKHYDQDTGIVTSETISARLHPEDMARLRAEIFSLAPPDRMSRLATEYRVVHRDGSVHWLSVHARVHFEEQNHEQVATLSVGTSQDITERKLAEQALHESEERYRSIFDGVQDAIFVETKDGKILEVNNRACEMFGYKRNEFLQKKVTDVVPEGGKVFIPTERQLKASIAPLETINKRANGELFPVELSGGLQIINSEEVVLVIVRDITERMQTKQNLLARTEELEALFNITDHLSRAQDEEQALSIVIEELQHILNTDANGILLLDGDKASFQVVRATNGLGRNVGKQFPASAGLSGYVLKEGQAYVTPDFSADQRKLEELIGVDGYGPAIFAPIRSETAFLGILTAFRRKGESAAPYSAANARLLTAIGDIVGNSLQRMRLLGQTASQLRQLQVLNKMDRAITGSLDQGLTLRLLLSEIITQLNVDAATVRLFDPYTYKLECAAAQGFRGRTAELSDQLIGQGFAGQAALNRETIHINDLLNSSDPQQKRIALEEGLKAYSVTPLITKGKVIGVIEFYNRQLQDRGADWDEFIETLANQATIAIENAHLFTDLQRSNLKLELAYDATIEGWSRAMDLRDRLTEGHSVKATEFAVGLASALGIRDEELIHLRRGALLHDIGKLGVPDHILLKSTALTAEEWEAIKLHPALANTMLHPIEFLRPALDIPYCHHEKWDGTGYPRGLSGEQIPLSARIFAVADVFEALTSDRPYRSAWSPEKAMAYLDEQSGKHFDPRVVSTFLDWIKNH